MPILGIVASSIFKKITDLFNRTTSGSLGTATSGQTWVATRGVWYANGSAAASTDAATTYPVASIPLGQNVTVNADTTGGCGLAFWVTDSGSWWGAFPYYSSSTSTTCSGGTAYCYTAGCTPANSCGAISESTTTTCSGGTAYCYTAGCTPANSCGAISESTTTTCTGATVSCSDTTNTCNPGGCGAVSSSSTVSSYSCPNSSYPYYYGGNCWDTPSHNGQSIQATPTGYTYTRTQNTNVTNYTRSSATNVTNYTRSSATNVTTTTYTSAARIISSVSGTVATDSTTALATSTSGYTNIASMQVNTSETTINVKGYSGAGQTTQLGSTITRTPSSPTRGTSMGIIKAPTTDNQGSTLDNFSATV